MKFSEERLHEKSGKNSKEWGKFVMECTFKSTGVNFSPVSYKDNKLAFPPQI
jgi:hypothetical protein